MGLLNKLFVLGIIIIVVGMLFGNESVRQFGLTIAKYVGLGILGVILIPLIFVFGLVVIALICVIFLAIIDR